MFGTQKRKILLWSVIFNSILLTSCSTTENVEAAEEFVIEGEAQGTTYRIIIADKDVNVSKSEIDSILHNFDLSLSTYVKESVISAINNAKRDTIVVDQFGYFKPCYTTSKRVFDLSNGAFDPTVFPLVSGWGFMKNMDTPLSQSEVDSIMQFVGFDKGLIQLTIKGDSIAVHKTNPEVRLDFNAIAQGQSVDVVADYLKAKGYSNIYVEIGGELYVSGKKLNGDLWRIGIDTPIEGSEERVIEQGILAISNKAVATSGNYRKFYVIDGKKYAHTLNPKTGFPVEHNLLSATIVADNCALADALATAMMVVGKDAGLKLIEKNQLNVEAYLIYEDAKGELQRVMTPGFQDLFE